MKLAISLSVGTLPLGPQVDAIIKILSAITHDYVVILCTHSVLDPTGTAMARKLAAQRHNVKTAIVNKGSFSRAYLEGWVKGAELGADYVISMDADGSHDPAEITKFVRKFESGHSVVCSSRFIPGARNKYPLQRQILSMGVTFLANTFLVHGKQQLTDFASGYEGVSAGAIKKMFTLCPPDKWVSVTTGPYHLQNTILRWLLIQCGYEIVEIPIQYGIGRKGKVLGMSYVFQALRGFFVLLVQKGKYSR